MNLITKLETLRAREHEATVELVRKLVECDRCGAHLELGYASIWDFLVRHLHYSNAAASRRYKAMKAAKRDPRVIPMLAKHQVNLSSLAMAEATLARSRDVLDEIAGKSQRQVEQIVARRNPQPKRRETVRRVAVVEKPAVAAPLFEAASGDSTSVAEVPAASRSGTDVSTHATSAAEVEDRVRLAFDVSEATHEDIEKARAILSRKFPEGVTLAQLMDELLACYLAKHAPKPKRAQKRPSANPRHIPQATRDEVFRRDEGRCTYVGPTGVRCGSAHDVEVDHIEPFALGGSNDARNLRLLCAKHNRHRAQRTFGAAAKRRE